MSQKHPIRDFVDYIMSGPKVWSGAAKQYRKLSRQYLTICRNEVHNSQVDIFKKSILEEKYALSVKLEKLRKILSSPSRHHDRTKADYIKYKIKLFGDKLDKF